MDRPNKIVFRIMGSISTLLVLLCALILLAPRLINSGYVKQEIVASLSAKTGCEVKIAKIDLSLFPRPNVILHEARLSIPGKVSADIELITAYPRILPLLSGKLRIEELRAGSPDMEIRLRQAGGEWEKALQDNLGMILGPLFMQEDGLVLHVEDGKINLKEKEDSIFRFSDIRSRIESTSKQLKIDMTCESNLSQKVSLNGRLDLTTFKADGRIELSLLRPQLVADSLFPGASLRVGDSELDLAFAFKIEGFSSLKGEVRGSIPRLTLNHGNKKVVIRGKSIKGLLTIDRGIISGTLSELNLDYPQLRLSAEFHADNASDRVILNLEGREVDVPSTRKAALALAGDIPAVKEIFDIVRGGTVPLITIRTDGSKVSDLGHLKTTTIKGRMLEGEIFVPELGFDLQNVSGEAVISGGILQGKGLTATLGNTSGSEGILSLGLKGKETPLYLDILLKADLSEALPILQRAIKTGPLAQELRLVDRLKGSATGRLILEKRSGFIKTHMDISNLGFLAAYRRMPYPITISEGKFSYDNDRLRVQGLGGLIGRSSFSRLSGTVDWRKDPCVEIDSAKAGILLDEIYPWASSFIDLQGPLKKLSHVRGYVRMEYLDMKGPLFRPKDWRFRAECHVRDIVFSPTWLPGEVVVHSGDLAVDPRALSLRNARATALDAGLNLTGTFKGYMEGINRVEATIDGSLGPRATGSVLELIDLPEDLKVRSPVTISHGHLLWDKAGATSFKGKLSVDEGPDISLSVSKSPRKLKIEELLVKAEGSRASLRLNVKEDAFDIGFSGDLNKEVLDSLLQKNRIVPGWIKGDFSAHILKNRMLESTAEGRLQCNGLNVPGLNLPLRVKNISLSAGQDGLNVESADFVLGKSEIGLRGGLNFAEQGLFLDLDLLVDGIDRDMISRIFEREGKNKVEKTDQDVWSRPLRGTVRVKSDYFKYGAFMWRPLNADISFVEDGIEVAVTEADLCGISTPGTLRLTPQDLSLDLYPFAQNRQLKPAMHCLTGDRLTGIYNLKGHVTARGKDEDLAESVKGDLEFNARDGRIYQGSVWTKIFNYLNITELLAGRLPDLEKEGFEYSSMRAKGRLKEGKIFLKKGYIDGAPMDIGFEGEIDMIEKKLDITFLVAPMKTANRIIRYIPVLNYILDDKILSIAIKVSGDIADPEVRALPPSAVGSGLLGIMKRTLEAPIKLVEPLIREKGKNGKAVFE